MMKFLQSACKTWPRPQPGPQLARARCSKTQASSYTYLRADIIFCKGVLGLGTRPAYLAYYNRTARTGDVAEETFD